MNVNYLQLANALTKENKLEEAIVVYAQAIEQNPRFYWSYQNLGDVLFKVGRWEEAVNAYNWAIKLNSSSAWVYYNQGEAFTKLGRLDEAIACYQRAIELSPDEFEIHYGLAEALRLRNERDLVQAIAMYKRLIELNPDSVEAYTNLLKIQPDNWEMWWQLANLYSKQSQREDLIACYQQVISLNPEYLIAYEKLTQLQPNNWENCYILGEKLEGKGERERAIACYQQVISLNPEYLIAYEKLTQLQPSNWENWYVLGEKLEGKGETERAIACYQQVIGLNPNLIAAYNKLLQLEQGNWDIWAKMGNSLLKIEREAEAISAYQRAIELNPGFVQAYEMLLQLQPHNCDLWAKFGNSLVTLKRQAEAISAYQRAIEINPRFIQAYEMLLQLQPDNWDILFRLSNAYAKHNTWKKAIEIYENLISIKPNLAETHYELAKAIARSRKINQSINSSEIDISTIKPDLVKELRHLAEQMSKDSESGQLIEYDQRVIETYPYSSEFFWEMGRLLLMESKREKAMFNFYKSNQIKFYQMLAKGELGAIFVCSLPKSATLYISDGLLKGLNLPGLSLNRNIGGINDYYLNLSYPEKFYNSINRSVTSGVWVDHTNPSEWNVFAISLTLDRLVVNLRDPRQTILSWIAHMNKARREGNQIELFRNFKYPEGYYLMTLNEKIDWEIKSGFLPYAIKWIQGWLDAEKNPLFHPKILFTKFEDLATNPQVFWESILEFYEIEKTRFTFPEPPKFKEGTHYRKGSINEWREVFTPEQAEQASSMIPKEFIEKFGWS